MRHLTVGSSRDAKIRSIAGHAPALRRSARVLTALAVLLLAARGTLAARFTTILDPVEAVLEQRIADDATSRALRKTFRSGVRRLAQTTTSLAQEVAAAKAVLPPIEKKAPADTALQALVGPAIDALASDAAEFIEGVDSRAGPLRMKAAPIVGIDRHLTAARGALDIALAPGTAAARLKALATAVSRAVKADKAVRKATGGGGGDACGPTPKPAGLRALLANESFTAHVDDSVFQPPRIYDFAAGSIRAHAGPYLGFDGAPVVLDVTAYDCTRQSALTFSIPYPPVVNQTYRSGVGGTAGVNGGSRYVWDGATQVDPNGTMLKATAFNAQARTVTIEFSFGNVTQGVATLRGWMGE